MIALATSFTRLQEPAYATAHSRNPTFHCLIPKLVYQVWEFHSPSLLNGINRNGHNPVNTNRITQSWSGRERKESERERKKLSRDSPSRVNNLGSHSHLQFDGTVQINEQSLCFAASTIHRGVSKLRPQGEDAAGAFRVSRLAMRLTTLRWTLSINYQHH
jgi:hypothetical protein